MKGESGGRGREPLSVISAANLSFPEAKHRGT